MTEKDKLRLLYALVLRREKITTKLLNDIGLNSRDIKKFIDLGIITRIKRGLYDFNVSSDLVDYAFGYQTTNFELMIKFFQKIFSKSNSFNKVTYYLFIDSIKKQNFEDMIKYFNVLYQNDKGYYIKDFKLFLLIMREFAILPPYYEVEALTMSLESVILTEDEIKSRYGNAMSQGEFSNEVRKKIFYGKYEDALMLLSFDNGNKFGKNILGYALEMLLESTIYNKDLKIQNFIESEDFDGLIQFLKNLKEKGNYTTRDHCIYILASSIRQLEQGTELISPSLEKPKTLYSAIQSFNFDYAINHFEMSDPIIKALLNRVQMLNTNCKVDTTFNGIVNLLIDNNFDEAFIHIKELLPMARIEEIEIIKYMYLLDLSLKNTIFTDTIELLSYLKRGGNVFSLTTKYLNNLKESIEKGYVIDACIYLKILKNIEILINRSLNLKQYETFIKHLLRIERFDENIDIEKTILEAYQKSIEENVDITYYLQPVNIKPNINKKIDELENGVGACVFDNLDEETYKQIKNTVYSSNRLRVVYENDEEKKLIVKTHKFYEGYYIDHKMLVSKGRFYFNYGNYQGAIECFETLLLTLKAPRIFIYWYLAKAYAGIGNFKKAYDYIYVVKCFDNISNIKFRHENDYKIFEMKNYSAKLEEYEKTQFRKLQLVELEKIAELVISGEIEEIEAYDKYCADEEEIIILKVILAKLYKMHGDSQKSDGLYSEVEDSAYKSDFVMELIDEDKYSFKRELQTVCSNAYTIKPIESKREQ